VDGNVGGGDEDNNDFRQENQKPGRRTVKKEVSGKPETSKRV
jgi:hypothetical protein